MKITVGTTNGLTVSNKLKTVVAIVLDRSGSMASVAKETIQGLNQEIQAATATYMSTDQMSAKDFWGKHAKGSRRVNC